MPTRQRLPATRMLCAKHGNKRAQTGDFSSPLPHFAHDDRSETSTFTQSALRARTYARLSWFSFFTFTSSPALHKSLSISALRVKTLSFSPSHLSSPSDRIINNSKQSLFQQNKTRQLPFLLRSIGGEGKKPKAFTPNKLLHKDLSTPREGVKGEKRKPTDAHARGRTFSSHGVHAKFNLYTRFQEHGRRRRKNYFCTTHADAIQRMGSKMSRILPPRDADKKTATWARPVAV